MVERVRAGTGDEDIVATLRRATGRMEIVEFIAKAARGETAREILERACRKG